MPCSRITLESRGDQDQSDLDLLQKFRAQKVITSGLRVHHSVGRVEPALWVADIVCGAVVQDRVGDSSYLHKISEAVEIHHIRRVILWLTSSPTSMERRWAQDIKASCVGATIDN